MKWLSFSVRFSLVLLMVGCALLIASSGDAAGTIRHVTPAGGSTGQCSDMSWTDPCTLQYALSIASAGDEIWVKAGTYLPSSTRDRTASFNFRDGVGMYGGFLGNETVRGQRNWQKNKTILSGDLIGNDSGAADWNNSTYADNSYHVITATNVSAASVLDGFTIRGGNAEAGEFGRFPKSGGGLSIVSSSPTLMNLIISANVSHGTEYGDGGGGIMLSDPQCKPVLTNILFIGNQARNQGGGLHNHEGSPVLTNVTFVGNHAEGSGGAIFTRYGSMPVRNTIIWGNSAPSGYSISIGVTNITFSNSDIEGGCPTGIPPDGCNATVLSVDPGFILASGVDGIYGTTDDYPRLQKNSPVIDKGSNTVANPSLPSLDLAGNQRIYQNVVDMGAFEWVGGDPPLSSDQTFYGPRNLTITRVILAIDPDGDPLTFALVSQPSSGTFHLNADGHFTYTPSPGYTGAITFRFTVTDGKSDLAGPYTVTIRIGYPTYLPMLRK